MSVYRSGKAGGKQWRGEFTHPVTKERVRAPRRFYTKAEGLEWVLTDDEVDLIARNIKRPEDQLLVWTLAYTGLRFGEAAALKQEYVDLRAKLIRVRWTLDKRTGDLKELKGSNDAYRTVPIPSWLAERLDLGVPRGRVFVFQALRGGLIRYDNWRKRTWEPALVSARLQEPRPTIHDLRHFYGTKLGAAGVGEGNIAALMGHSAMSRITRRYVQPTESRLEQARQVMGG